MTSTDAPERRYSLAIVQQPKRAKATTDQGREVRPVEPYPILRLRVQYLDPGFMVQVTLYDETGREERAIIPPDPSAPGAPPCNNMQLGTNVVHGSYVRDLDDRFGCFFCFANIRVRLPGRYCLRFSLMQVPRGQEHSEPTRILQHVDSNTFRVYASTRDYPGTVPTSELAKKLAKQIPGISIRNKGLLAADYDSDGDAAADDGGPAPT
ncbi:hypothetical protein H4R18_003765 [Coemansia javaensis]|uniref:Velvet domain-containing protein n=1 Tax=Coemansia javaensis TaxID=2761396 RepID=A0A9W8H9I3_9FUNG|nr:hypothetical protein H4R18_003765 [Coemansia javaensis]